MALEKNLVRSENKVKGEFPTAYIRVMSVETMESGVSRIRIAGFVDADAKKLALDPAAVSGSNPPMPHMIGNMTQAAIYEKTIEASLPAAPAGTYKNLQEQEKAAAYVHLKTLPDFLTAKDC